jgi:hypothetical protein
VNGILFGILLVILSQTGPFEGESGYHILGKGWFHGSEVETSDGDIWLAVFPTGDGSVAKRIELVVRPAYDPYLDHDDEMTARTVYSASLDGMKPLFFLRPVDSVFTEGGLPTALTRSPVLMPDTTLELMGSSFLYTTEEGLYLSDGQVSQRLSDVYPVSYGERVSVVWAGDLDGDGLVDLVLDDQGHYAMNLFLRLFLSSEAEPGFLVREVASFMAVSC